MWPSASDRRETLGVHPRLRAVHRCGRLEATPDRTRGLRSVREGGWKGLVDSLPGPPFSPELPGAERGSFSNGLRSHRTPPTQFLHGSQWGVAQRRRGLTGQGGMERGGCAFWFGTGELLAPHRADPHFKGERTASGLGTDRKEGLARTDSLWFVVLCISLVTSYILQNTGFSLLVIMFPIKGHLY